MNEEYPRLELEKVLQRDAEEIIAARERAVLIHKTKNIDAAGHEVEQSVRKILRNKLATKYYIGHGHILDSDLSTSPQLDVIVANNLDAPIIFKTENGTEYFPFESIYAIGEVKSTYYKNKKYIHSFSDKIHDIKSKLKRELTLPSDVDALIGSNKTLKPSRPYNNRPYHNPLFSFVLFANSNDFHPDDIEKLYGAKSPSALPNIICFLDRGVVLNEHYWQDENGNNIGSPNTIPEFNKELATEPSRWVFFPWTKRYAANFGYLIFMLSEHLRHAILTPPRMYTYLYRIFYSTEPMSIIAQRKR